ncbi:MAG: sugar phosphate isomerase/epimerase family protein [Butyricicoccus sp.]|nr:sugar phosphate isomerase/epimerase family protein [Butyricicoccus sp.]
MDYKIGIVEWAFPFPGPYGLKIAAELGLQGMELDFGEYETGYQLYQPRIQQAYLECGKEYGIEFPAIALNALNTHGMSKDRDTADGIIAVETIQKGIETAQNMGIPVVQLPSFGDGDIQCEQDFYNTCEKVRFACDLVKGSEITIAVENVLDAEQTKRMLQEVGSPQLKVFYDTQNYHLDRGYSQPEILEAIADDVAQIHVKDGYNHTISSALLGRGDVSFFKTAEVIRRTQCTKWLFLENYYNRKPLSLLHRDAFELIRRDIETLRTVFS